MTTFFKINELSQKAGIHRETIRYYEKIGLLSQPQRTASGYRLYDESALQCLTFIKSCRTLGLSLEEIKQLYQIQTTPQADCQDADEMIQHHLQQVQSKIRQLKKIEKLLKKMAHCGKHNVEQCNVMIGLRPNNL